ncbi:hypothetical protein L0F63_006200, partial [Massospora cicadina]
AVNAEREKQGLKKYNLNEKLVKAATQHSSYQAKAGTYTHDGENGESFAARCRSVGYGDCGENVYGGSSDIKVPMQFWMGSTVHRNNILSQEYVDFGAAVVNGYWTQNFGKGETGGSSKLSIL